MNAIPFLLVIQAATLVLLVLLAALVAHSLYLTYRMAGAIERALGHLPPGNSGETDSVHGQILERLHRVDERLERLPDLLNRLRDGDE